MATPKRRDVGSEILEGLRQIKRGEHGRVTTVPSVATIRARTELSQSRFAELLGVSVRTLQEWEQGRRAPSGAARTLLMIAAKNPRALIDPCARVGKGRWLAAAVGLVILAASLLTEHVGARQRSMQTAADARACAQGALGGVDLLASVASLTVAFDVVPAPGNDAGQPMATEMVLTFPDRFTKTDRAQLAGREVLLTRGVFGDRAQGRDQSPEALRTRRSEFARWAFVLLLRETAAIPLRWSQPVESDATHVTIAVSGPEGFGLDLTVDQVTCYPTAVAWEREAGPADAQAGRTAAAGHFVERYELSAYEVFGGIRLPKRIQMTTDGAPRFEWAITSATVDQRLSQGFAR